MRRCMLHDRSCNWHVRSPVGSMRPTMTLVPSRIFPQRWQYCTNHVLPMPCMARHGTARHGILRRCHYAQCASYAVAAMWQSSARRSSSRASSAHSSSPAPLCAHTNTGESVRPPLPYSVYHWQSQETKHCPESVGSAPSFEPNSQRVRSCHSHRGCPLGAARRIPPRGSRGTIGTHSVCAMHHGK